ncbi:MAG: DUF3098 domain-containing protein [Bacteroidetes bacterium]|nr:DUF3098 domain-containing protein [Bacteroidota bacterium]
MSEAKKHTPVTNKPVHQVHTLFNKENYKWMAIGGVIIILGMVLMSGGKSQDPNVFDPKEVYSTTRITIAPILIIGGLLLELYAILRRPKQKANV